MSKSQPLSDLDQNFTEDELALVKCKSDAMLIQSRLNELMRQLGKTKAQLPTESTLTSEEISLLEDLSSDLNISQLNRYVQALGGRITITLTHPKGDVILL